MIMRILRLVYTAGAAVSFHSIMMVMMMITASITTVNSFPQNQHQHQHCYLLLSSTISPSLLSSSMSKQQHIVKKCIIHGSGTGSRKNNPLFSIDHDGGGDDADNNNHDAAHNHHQRSSRRDMILSTIGSILLPITTTATATTTVFAPRGANAMEQQQQPQQQGSSNSDDKGNNNNNNNKKEEIIIVKGTVTIPSDVSIGGGTDDNNNKTPALYVTCRPDRPDNVPAAILNGSRGKPPPVLIARYENPTFPFEFQLTSPRDLTVEGAGDGTTTNKSEESSSSSSSLWWKNDDLIVSVRLDSDGIAATRSPDDLVGRSIYTTHSNSITILLSGRGAFGKFATTKK